ncbi:MAG: CRISPR-associated endonuclease Cas2 [Anaerorhabdus sp.]
MRILVFFDLPTETSQDLKEYRKLTKFFKENGYLRIQYSIYCKLCINSNAAITARKKLEKNIPPKGDMRYLILSEMQYQSIKTITDKFSLNEAVTNRSRLLIIGGNDGTKNIK